MATRLDLADAQFIGFKAAKWCPNIIHLIESMGLTKSEWIKWKNDYPAILDEADVNEIDQYFNK